MVVVCSGHDSNISFAMHVKLPFNILAIPLLFVFKLSLFFFFKEKLLMKRIFFYSAFVYQIAHVYTLCSLLSQNCPHVREIQIIMSSEIFPYMKFKMYKHNPYINWSYLIHISIQISKCLEDIMGVLKLSRDT